MMKITLDEHILSRNMFNVMVMIKKAIPVTTFGGSLALNVVGLLNREIKDLDVLYPTIYSDPVTDSQYVGMDSFIKCQQLETSSSLGFKRYKLNNIEVCFINVSYSRLTYEPIIVNNEIFNIAGVNHAIMFKQEHLGITKHNEDMQSINNKFNLLFPI